MGWLWNSNPESTEPPPDSQTTSSNPPPKAPELVDNPVSTSTSSSPPKHLTREEQADAELSQILSELSSATSADRSSTSVGQDGPSNSILKFHPSAAPAATSRDAASLYPSEMSCRDAFDSAFYCQSLGGQFNNVYRYGEFRPCSEHWSAFWFCMKTKSMGDSERTAKIREFYKKKDAKYKVGPSSEDVWHVRTEPVDRAFDMDPDLVDIPGLSKGRKNSS